MADNPESAPDADPFEGMPNNPIARRMGRPKGAKDKRKRVRRPRLPQVLEIKDLVGASNIVQAFADAGHTVDKLNIIRGLQTYIMGIIGKEVNNKDTARREGWRALLWTLHQMEVISSRERAALANDITPSTPHTNVSRAVDLGDFKLNSELE